MGAGTSLPTGPPETERGANAPDRSRVLVFGGSRGVDECWTAVDDCKRLRATVRGLRAANQDRQIRCRVRPAGALQPRPAAPQHNPDLGLGLERGEPFPESPSTGSLAASNPILAHPEPGAGQVTAQTDRPGTRRSVNSTTHPTTVHCRSLRFQVPPQYPFATGAPTRTTSLLTLESPHHTAHSTIVHSTISITNPEPQPQTGAVCEFAESQIRRITGSPNHILTLGCPRNRRVEKIAGRHHENQRNAFAGRLDPAAAPDCPNPPLVRAEIDVDAITLTPEPCISPFSTPASSTCSKPTHARPSSSPSTRTPPPSSTQTRHLRHAQPSSTSSPPRARTAPRYGDGSQALRPGRLRAPPSPIRVSIGLGR